MAYKVVFTRSAQKDLDAILAYLSVELCNPAAASALLTAIEQACLRLSEHPQLYPVCAHPLLAAPGYRKVFIRGYLLLYRADQAAVYVERFFSDMEDYAQKL